MIVQVVNDKDGQAGVRKVLQDLGGRATNAEIRAEIAKRIADHKMNPSQLETFSISLQRMKKKYEVDLVPDNKRMPKAWYWVEICGYCRHAVKDCKCQK
jgi:hypothetical protein